MTGIWVEETDALYQDEQNGISTPGDEGDYEYQTGYLCDLIHTETARTLMVYTKDFYKGTPAVTVNQYGKGQAYYIASRVEERYLDILAGQIMDEQKVRPVLIGKGDIEIDCREKNGIKTWFLINYGKNDGEVELGDRTYQDVLHPGKTWTGTTVIPAGDVFVLS